MVSCDRGSAAHEAVQGLPLFIGGKSMGGRIASQVAAQGGKGSGIHGLVFLGYPLHPPGRPEQRRDAHLPAIKEPMLFVQGSGPVWQRRGDSRASADASAATLHEIAEGDHSFKVRVPPPEETETPVLNGIFDAVAGFVLRPDAF